MNALPTEAEALVSRIEGMLAQADELLASGGSDEAAYALRETERRYLPDTLRAYLDVPPARRDETAAMMLVEQLRLLERATAQRLSVLAESAQTALAANGAFLTERFGPLETLPEAPATAALDPATAPPATLVRRVFERLAAQAGPTPGALLELAAEQLPRALPAIASVRRGGFLGGGPIQEVWLDVPRRDDMMRYSLVRAPHGGVEARVTRFLRGIKNRTLTCDVDEWMRGLTEDLSAYAERERTTHQALTRFLTERR
ncbi:MAG TPA: hypothetical protein VFE70_02735 [Candidatus Elarobacter sp.]|nr:hypothetical protein [Candidatus Elarobacter sp.]